VLLEEELLEELLELLLELEFIGTPPQADSKVAAAASRPRFLIVFI